jgi:hypothetical protein
MKSNSLTYSNNKKPRLPLILIILIMIIYIYIYIYIIKIKTLVTYKTTLDDIIYCSNNNIFKLMSFEQQMLLILQKEKKNTDDKEKDSYPNSLASNLDHSFIKMDASFFFFTPLFLQIHRRAHSPSLDFHEAWRERRAKRKWDH